MGKQVQRELTANSIGKPKSTSLCGPSTPTPLDQSDPDRLTTRQRGCKDGCPGLHQVGPTPPPFIGSGYKPLCCSTISPLLEWQHGRTNCSYTRSRGLRRKVPRTPRLGYTLGKGHRKASEARNSDCESTHPMISTANAPSV
jgi:hypothetical protein